MNKLELELSKAKDELIKLLDSYFGFAAPEHRDKRNILFKNIDSLTEQIEKSEKSEPEISAKKFLESKGIFSLDTKKRTLEVYEWMEEFARQFSAQSVKETEETVKTKNKNKKPYIPPYPVNFKG